MAHKNAIIVPTHPKDFHWTYQLLSSAKENEEIIIIFSSEEDYEQFEMECKYIIVPPKPDYIEAHATYKKLYALSKLYDKYDYIATIDTEAIFLKEVCPYLQDIWNNNCIVANKSMDGHKYIESCLEDLHIKNYPYNTSMYFWFNDIQVYPCALIPEFLTWIFGKNIRKNSFDYLIFGIFMIIKKGHTLRILDCDEEIKNGLIEDLNVHQSCKELLKHVNWSCWFEGVYEFENIKILFHLDRYSTE